MLYDEFTRKNNMLLIAFLFVLFSIAGAIYFIIKSPQVKNTIVREEISEVKEVDKNVVNLPQEEYNAVFIDVSGGDAVGRALVSIVGEKYFLRAVAENLPILDGDYFYEGWLVIPGEEGAFISTGEFYLDDKGVYINEFETSAEFKDHKLYVVTLEPKDDDPLPAEHILEGLLSEGTGFETGTIEEEENVGIYAFYEGVLPAISQEVALVLFFTSEECADCSSLEDNIIENLNAIPPSIFILKTEMEKHTEFVEEYAPIAPHTLIQISRDGEELRRWEGSTSLQEILANII